MKSKLFILVMISIIFLVGSMNVNAECEEQWSCTAWSSCEEGIKTRECTDENNCGTDIYKPFESLPCSKSEQVNTFDPTILLFSVGLIVLVVLGGWYYRKKVTTKKEHKKE